MHIESDFRMVPNIVATLPVTVGRTHCYSVCSAFQIPGKWWLLSQLWRHVAATQGSDTVKMAVDNTDMLLVHLLLGAEAFLLVQIASLPAAKETDSRSGEGRHYRWRHLGLLSRLK